MNEREFSGQGLWTKWYVRFTPRAGLTEDELQRYIRMHALGVWLHDIGVALCVGFAVVVLLAGCAAPAPPVTVRVPVEVKVPVPVPCVAAKDLPARPMLASDAELAKLSGHDLIITVDIHRRALRAWLLQVEPLLAACSRP